jgi:hypothetical protein
MTGFSSARQMWKSAEVAAAADSASWVAAPVALAPTEGLCQVDMAAQGGLPANRWQGRAEVGVDAGQGSRCSFRLSGPLLGAASNSRPAFLGPACVMSE